MLKDNIKRLEKVTRDIAVLNTEKEDLIKSIIKELNHSHEGQKSYSIDEYKLEVRTPAIYSLNKEYYQEVSSYLPDDYNPVKESVSYSIDKKKCDELLKTAPSEFRKTLIEMVEKKPGKANVVVKYQG